MPLIPGSTLITGAKRYADANDPNAGAWLDTPAWQEWLDSVYAVFFDRLLFSGAVTPFPTDTTLNYDPNVGYMTLPNASARALVDVFRVTGSGPSARYDILESAQHRSQFPNLDLMTTYPAIWGGGVGPGPWGGQSIQPFRAWAAFMTDSGNVRVQVSPKQTADTYMIRSVSDPDTSGGYNIPAVGRPWVELSMATMALATERVFSQALNTLLKDASDALQGYLDTFQLHNNRKVSEGPGPYRGAWGNPSLWWWRS